MEDISSFVSITPSQSSGYDSSEAAQGKYKCPVCNYSSDYHTVFLKHTELHEKNSEFRCRFCSYSSHSESNIMQHQREDHSPAVIVRHPILLQPERQSESLRKTKRNSEDDPVEVSVLHCPECLYWNRFTSAFHEHLMTHRSDAAFLCSECAYKTNQRNRITKHIRELREAGQHSCAEVLLIHPIPEDEYASYRRMAFVKSNVVSGWRDVEEGNDTGIEMEDSTSSAELAPVKLEEISISGEPSQNCLSHSEVVEDSEWGDIQMDSGVNEPDESTKGNETHEQHERIEEEEEEVSRQCSTPPSVTFKRPGKTHECNICQFTSTEASKLRTHMIFHTRSSGFRCAICSYSSSKRSLTELHMKRDHRLPINHLGASTDAQFTANQLKKDTGYGASIQSNVFCCPNCTYWNKTISTFHEHLLGHQSSSPFKCSNCKFSSKHRTRINQHIRNKKKDGKASHSNARTELTHPIPDSGYAEFRFWIPVPKGARYGWIKDVPRENNVFVADCLPSPQNDVIIEDETQPPTIVFQPVVEKKSPPPPSDDIDIIYEDNKNDRFHFASQLPSFQDLLISSRAIGPGRKKVRQSVEASMKNEKVKKFISEDEVISLKVIQIIDSIRSASSTLNETKEVPVLTLSDTWLQEKVNSARSKVEAMTERMKQTEKELSEIKMKKEEALKKLKDAIRVKIKTEFNLRTFQCKVLSLSISEFDSLSTFKVNDPSVLAEEKLQKEEVARTELVVKTIQEKNKRLSTMLQDAEKSRDGFVKVLQVLQSELQMLELELDELHQDCSQNRTKEMVTNIQEQIEAYSALEERRFKIKFLKARAQVRQKQKNCMEMLKKDFVDEEASFLRRNNYSSPDQSPIEIFPD